MAVMVFARWIINLTSSPVAPCSCVTLPSSPGSMLAMETLARLVMLDREKEDSEVYNWTIKATIRGEVMRELGVIYNSNYYSISEHPSYLKELPESPSSEGATGKDERR